MAALPDSGSVLFLVVVYGGGKGPAVIHLTKCAAMSLAKAGGGAFNSISPARIATGQLFGKAAVTFQSRRRKRPPCLVPIPATCVS